MPRLIERLQSRAAHRFVGREDELALMRSALSVDPSPWPVWLLHGPGGIGKTALLARLRDLAAEAGVDSIRLDARDVDATPKGFLHALGLALGLAPDTGAGELAPLLQRLESAPRRLLVVDTFEALRPLEAWLRETFLPALPDRTITVLAGRTAPHGDWCADPLWQDAVRVIALPPLNDAQARRCLQAQGVAERWHEQALALAHGHPLVLTLIGNVVRAQGALPDRLGGDVLRDLADRFTSLAPTLQHRRALQVCAYVRRTTESLLAEVVDADQAVPLFDWLASLNFIERADDGLFPHDLVREAVEQDMASRDPQRCSELRGAVDRVLAQRARSARPEEMWTRLRDLQFRHRHTGLARYFDLRSSGVHRCRPAVPADVPGCRSLLQAEFAGPDFELAARWLAHPASTVWVAGAGKVDALCLAVDPDHVAARGQGFDPWLAEIVACLDAQMPLPPGRQRRVTLYNVVRGGNLQTEGGLANAIQGALWYLWNTTPNLQTWTVCIERPDHWREMMDHMGFAPLQGALGERAGIAVGCFWLDPGQTGVPAESTRAAPPAGSTRALSPAEFNHHLREALRQWQDDSALALNPLLHCAFLRSAVGSDAATPQHLRAVLLAQARALGEHPREAKFWRALELTFFRPAGTQELAAERLGLPFGTYRYQLATGIDRLAERLRRLQGDASQPQRPPGDA